MRPPDEDDPHRQNDHDAKADPTPWERTRHEIPNARWIDSPTMAMTAIVTRLATGIRRMMGKSHCLSEECYLGQICDGGAWLDGGLCAWSSGMIACCVQKADF